MEYKRAFDESQDEIANYQQAIADVRAGARGVFGGEKIGTTFTKTFEAYYGQDWVSKMTAGFAYADEQKDILQRDTALFDARLTQLKELPSQMNTLNDWRTEPDTAALFLDLLINVRVTKKAFAMVMLDRLQKNVQSLLSLEVPLNTQFGNLEKEIQAASYFHEDPNAPPKLLQPGKDPRNWGTQVTLQRNNRFDSNNLSIYGGADRALDKESAWVYLSSWVSNLSGVKTGPDLVPEQSNYPMSSLLGPTIVEKVIGAQISGTQTGHAFIGVTPWFNFHQLAYMDGTSSTYDRVVSEYRYHSRTQDIVGNEYTVFYIASANPRTGGIYNIGQACMAIPLPKESALMIFKKYYPGLETMGSADGQGEFEETQELQTWKSISNKGDYYYLTRIANQWDWNDEKHLLSPGPSSTSVSRGIVYAVPRYIFDQATEHLKKIPKQVEALWQTAYESWEKYHENPAAYLESNPLLRLRFGDTSDSIYADRTWEWFLNAPSAPGSHLNLKKEYDRLLLEAAYISSLAWLDNKTYQDLGLDKKFPMAATPKLPNIRSGTHTKIYSAPIDNNNDLEKIVIHLRKQGALTNMSEAPVLDMPNFEIVWMNQGQQTRNPIIKDDYGIYSIRYPPKLQYQKATGSNPNNYFLHIIKEINALPLTPVVTYGKTMNVGGNETFKVDGDGRVQTDTSGKAIMVPTKRYVSTSYYRVPINTRGVSGKVYGSPFNVGDRISIPSAVPAKTVSRLENRLDSGFVSLPMATGITAVLVTAFWALGSGRNN